MNNGGGASVGGPGGPSRQTPSLRDPNTARQVASTWSVPETNAGAITPTRTKTPRITNRPTRNLTAGTLRGQVVAVSTCLLEQTAAVGLHRHQLAEQGVVVVALFN